MSSEAAFTPEEIARHRDLAEVRARALYPYIVSIIMGDPTGTTGAPINTASGVIVRLPSGPALATADHVLCEYDKRRGERLLAFQAGDARINLDERTIWRRGEDDLALIALSEDEAAATRATISVPFAWPPRIPPADSLAIVMGLPRGARTAPSAREVYFGPMVAQVPVLSAYENHFTCKLDRDTIQITVGQGLPEAPFDFGGMSGGPVFVEANWGYPLVGFVKEVHDELEYFVVQGFGNAPDRL